MFLLVLSKIALSILLALGPLFIALLFFETTKRFFECLDRAARELRLRDDPDRAGGRPHDGHRVLGRDSRRRMRAAASRSAMPCGCAWPRDSRSSSCARSCRMAAGLASGLALIFFRGNLLRAIAWGLGRARGTGRQLGQFGRGLALDRETTHYDTLSRKAGYQVQRGIRTLARRENTPARRRSRMTAFNSDAFGPGSSHGRSSAQARAATSRAGRLQRTSGTHQCGYPVSGSRPNRDADSRP